MNNRGFVVLSVFMLNLLHVYGFFTPTNHYILGNQSNTVDITFYAPLGVDSSLVHCTWAHDGQAISVDGTKYVQPTSRRLRIHNVVGADEGRYTCHYNYHQQQASEHVANIYVLGTAEFATTQDSPITARVGEQVRLDTRVAFVGAGPEQMKQRVSLLQLYKDGSQVYLCRNWNGYETSPCTSSGRFTVEMQSSDKFDFLLNIANVQLDDSGNYEARLEVVHPATGSYTVIKKELILNVTAPPKPPVVSTGASGVSNQGEVYTLTCNVSIPEEIVVRGILLRWLNPSGMTISSTSTRTNLDITFTQLSPEDEGSYTCIAAVSIQGSEQHLIANSSMEVILNEILVEEDIFQLCLGPFFLSDCSALAVDSVKRRQLESDIRAEISSNVLKRCPLCASDEAAESFIQPGTLKCSETAARLIYRSSVEATGPHNASEIVQIINEWVSSSVPGEATVQLWPFIMDLDSRCSVSIASLDSPYPTLGEMGSQFQLSSVKERVEYCLSTENTYA